MSEESYEQTPPPQNHRPNFLDLASSIHQKLFAIGEDDTLKSFKADAIALLNLLNDTYNTIIKKNAEEAVGDKTEEEPDEAAPPKFQALLDKCNSIAKELLLLIESTKTVKIKQHKLLSLSSRTKALNMELDELSDSSSDTESLGYFFDHIQHKTLPMEQGLFYIVDIGFNDEGVAQYRIQAMSRPEQTEAPEFKRNPDTRSQYYWPISSHDVFKEHLNVLFPEHEERTLLAKAWSQDEIKTYTQVDIDKTQPTPFDREKTIKQACFEDQFANELAFLERFLKNNQNQTLAPYWNKLLEEIKELPNHPELLEPKTNLLQASRKVVIAIKNKALSMKEIESFNEAVKHITQHKVSQRLNAIMCIIQCVLIIAGIVALACCAPNLAPFAFNALGLITPAARLMAFVVGGAAGGLVTTLSSVDIYDKSKQLHSLSIFNKNRKDLQSKLNPQTSQDPSSPPANNDDGGHGQSR